MPRPFFEVLRELRAGKTNDDLAENLAQILAAVRQTGKSGELTLKLKVKPPRAGGGTYCMIEDSIATKIPKLDHGDTVFFHTADGGLSRQDPSQQELKFVAVPNGAGPVKEVVAAATGEIIQLGGE
jgi:hypothetical protein